MTICKFYLEGRCKFGSQCQNEHRGQPSYGGNSRYNNPQRSDIYDRISYVSGSTNNNKTYDERSVRTDLTKDRPLYRYSTYGPGKEEPNLVDGTDYSPEELRLQYYIIMGTVGNDIQYQNGVKDLENRTQTQIDSCLKDLRNSLNRFESQKQQKQQSSFEIFGSSGGAFGQPQPQGFGTPQNTFGAFNTNQPPTFGGTPAFGQNTIGFPETQQGFGTHTMGGFGQNVASNFVPTQPTGGFGAAQPDPYLQQQQFLQQQQQQQQQALFAAQQLQQQQLQQTPQFMELQQQQQQQQQPTAFETNISQTTDWDMYQVPERPPPQR